MAAAALGTALETALGAVVPAPVDRTGTEGWQDGGQFGLGRPRDQGKLVQSLQDTGSHAFNRRSHQHIVGVLEVIEIIGNPNQHA